MLNNDETLLLLERAKKGDDYAKEKLISFNSPLIKSIVKNTLLRAVLHHATQLHNAHFVRNMLYYRQIVRNEYVRQTELTL